MKEPETIRGYLNILKNLEKMTITDKKGFDSLPDKVKEGLKELSGQISNIVNEILEN